MIEVDGGSGGGQLVRTALSLGALTGTPVRLDNVRGARSSPGLRHQHVACLDLFADICDADVSGAAVGSETFEFTPSRIGSGTYEIDIGTAGSVPLVFDAVIPLALGLKSPLTVTGHGGTDVAWSPPMDYQSKVKLPLLRDRGLFASVERLRPGFYPKGGGTARLWVAPSSMDAIEITASADVTRTRVYSLASESLADTDVAERQAETAVSGLEEEGFTIVERCVKYARADSAGSSVVIRLETDEIRAGVSALGEPGKPAETVADEAVAAASGVRESASSLDRHLADQLLVPLALAGGRLTIPMVTDHVTSAVELMDAFGFAIHIDGDSPATVVAPGADLE